MKILILDNLPFMYPEGIDNLEDFTEYANKNFYSFVQLNEISMKDCVYPYFVEDDITPRYVNLSLFKYYFEDDVELLSRYEYDERLKVLQEAICVHCKNYSEDDEGDNLDGHRDEMRLDGYCPNFDPIDDDFEEPDDEYPIEF
jgi:hypothetical protein